MRPAERGAAWTLAALLLTNAGGAAPSVTVTRRGEHLDVEAQASPLSEVLDAVAKELGASVEYEGTPPRFPVTLTLKDRTPAEAVLSLLDGTGVDYALQLDRSGRGVVKLLVQSGTASASRSQPPRPAPVRRAPQEIPTPPPIPEFPQPFDPAAEAEEADAGDPEEAPPPGPLTLPTPRPGRPQASPLLFPQPLLPLPTPTPQPDRD